MSSLKKLLLFCIVVGVLFSSLYARHSKTVTEVNHNISGLMMAHVHFFYFYLGYLCP